MSAEFDWREAHERTCRERHSLWASPREVWEHVVKKKDVGILSGGGDADSSVAFRLPTADGVALRSDEDLPRVLLEELRNRHRQRRGREEDSGAPAPPSSQASRASFSPPPSVPVSGAAAAVAASPVRWVAGGISWAVGAALGEADYDPRLLRAAGATAPAGDEGNRRRRPSASSPSLLSPDCYSPLGGPVPPPPPPAVAATDQVVSVEMAVAALEALLLGAAKAAAEAPVVLDRTEAGGGGGGGRAIRTWWLSGGAAAAAAAAGREGRKKNDDGVAQWMTGLPESQLEFLLFACLLPTADAAAEEEDLCAVEVERENAVVLGTRDETEARAAVARHRLDGAYEKMERQVQEWQERADAAGRRAIRGGQTRESRLRHLAQRKTCLRKIEGARGTLLNLERQRHALDGALEQRGVLAALRDSAETLRAVRQSSGVNGVEDVDEVMLDVGEEEELLRGIQHSLQEAIGVVGECDEEALMAELAELALDDGDGGDDEKEAATGTTEQEGLPAVATLSSTASSSSSPAITERKEVEVVEEERCRPVAAAPDKKEERRAVAGAELL